MPMIRSHYPDNWEEISKSIRERAGYKCEWCGVPNRALILRSKLDGSKYLIENSDGELCTPDGERVRESELPDEYDHYKFTRVVLTVAHIGATKPDGSPGDRDPMDCRPENLAALCQRCHLGYDEPDRIATQRRNRLAKRAEQLRQAGQLSLLNE